MLFYLKVYQDALNNVIQLFEKFKYVLNYCNSIFTCNSVLFKTHLSAKCVFNFAKIKIVGMRLENSLLINNKNWVTFGV